MHLLYLDESGNENDPTDRFFVLAGIALFERQTYFLTQALDGLQERHFPNHQPIPFHASEIRSGKGFWRKVADPVRDDVLQGISKAIIASPSKGRHLFAAVIEKSKDLWGEKAIEKATESICQRFDIFLKRQFNELSDAQRGILIFSTGRFDARAKFWVRDFHQRGTTWGTINNLADIPYFAAMNESRLLQAADYVSHATWLMYERGDAKYASPLLPCFDGKDGVLHGLVHIRPSGAPQCECPACYSRRLPGQHGPWVAMP